MAKSPHNGPAAHIWCQLEGSFSSSLGSLIGDTHTLTHTRQHTGMEGLTCDVLQLRWSTLIKSQQKTVKLTQPATATLAGSLSGRQTTAPPSSYSYNYNCGWGVRSTVWSRWKINISRIIKIPTVAPGKGRSGGDCEAGSHWAMCNYCGWQMP